MILLDMESTRNFMKQNTSLNLECRGLLRRSEVLKLTGLSKSTLYRLESSNDFPSAIQVSARCVAYRLSEIYKWLEGRN
ncbi:helix-turn-helix transcriptional regulator [Alteromonas sp. 07-89-2]|uniref:helix-turn-helix transcriptional regulator n=2 Tax=unclassified Alteromonas TaxID=2614992 RepID=UPI003461FD51